MTPQAADPVMLGTALNAIGLICEDADDYQLAAEAFSRALEILEESDDPAALAQLVPVLTNSARVQRILGDLEAATELCLDAIDIALALQPTQTRELAVARTELGIVYHLAGRFDDAEPLYWESLQSLQSTLGAGHPDTAVIWQHLAELSRAQGRLAEADRYARHAWRIRAVADQEAPVFAPRRAS